MAFLTKEQVLERFRKTGTNSSHFVWLITDLKYFECANGWLFGYAQVGDVTLLALEPMIPDAPTDYLPTHVAAFRAAWEEFSLAAGVKVAAFVSIYDPFLSLLRPLDFVSVKCGEEPWVDLKDCIPTGNTGKGVRSARNQAIGAGLKVEEWTAGQIAADPGKRQIMVEIYKEWKSHRLVNLSGFMNATDPFAFMEERRYFILRSPKRIEAYLIATPVPGIQSYFLEDLVIRKRAPRGAGELITLEAMVALGESGAKTSSLGVVSMNTLDPMAARGLPDFIKFVMVTVPKYMHAIYNFDGMNIYRKRFKPREWKNINIAVKNQKPGLSDTMAWLKVLFAVLIVFKPRLQLNWHWLKQAVVTPIRKYPLALGITTISTVILAKINHFGKLPGWALSRFGFASEVPVREWFMRSITSDYLYFDLSHFMTCVPPLFLLLIWAERTHKHRFLIPFVFCSFLLDDFVNYFLLIKPFHFFQPSLFMDLIAYKDVGSSLVLITLLGLQICQFRILREPLFAVLTMATVMIFAFTSAKLQWLIMNLNHVLFFMVGYLAGKAEFEYTRYKSRLASKRKPPTGKSVLSPPPVGQRKAA